MAIVIPSKNIYGIDNTKIRDNFINNVKVEQTIVNTTYKENIEIFKKSYENIDFISSDSQTWVGDFQKTYVGAPNNLDFVVAVSFSGYTKTAFLGEGTPYTVKIPISNDNYTITKLLLGENKETSEANIKYSIYGEYSYGAISCNYTGELQYVSGSNYNLIVNYDINNSTFGSEQDKKSFSYELPSEIKNTQEGFAFEGQNVDIKVESKKQIIREDNLKTLSFEYDDTNNPKFIILKISNLLCGVKTISMGGKTRTFASAGSGFPFSGMMSGVWKEYNPTSIEIIVKGNTMGIDLTNKSITIYRGNGDKPHSLKGNELLQETAKVDSNPLTNHLAHNVLDGYENGKESVTLLCDINEYYDTNGNLQISTKSGNKMTFDIGDEIIPMVLNYDGKNKPMSKTQNGEAKVFRVVGTKKFYDGAVWQEIYAQEK